MIMAGKLYERNKNCNNRLAEIKKRRKAMDRI
jgi:hypothetical protein